MRLGRLGGPPGAGLVLALALLIFLCFNDENAGAASRPDAAQAGSATATSLPAGWTPRPRIWGFADVHNHQFSNLGVGGLVNFGNAYDICDPDPHTRDPTNELARAVPWSHWTPVRPDDCSPITLGSVVPSLLSPKPFEPCPMLLPPILTNCTPNCPPDTSVLNPCPGAWVYGPGGVLDFFDKLACPGASALGHAVGGYPEFDGYPRWNNCTGQKVYYEWLKRAFDGGLKLMVMLAVNSEGLCKVLPHFAAFGCDDMPAVDRQIQAAKNLELYVDRSDNGTADGSGWYKIVYSPQQARQAISQGKLAVVLGVEVANLFGCKTEQRCLELAQERGFSTAKDYVLSELQALHNKGVRHIFPIHGLDNAFGGTATWNEVYYFGTKLATGRYPTLTNDCPPGFQYHYDSLDLLSTVSTVLQARQVLMSAFGGLGPLLIALAAAALVDSQLPPAPPTGPNCNAQGLTQLGRDLVNGVMDRKMILDIDHMSARSIDSVLNIAETRKYSAIISGHTNMLSAADPDIDNDGNPDFDSNTLRHEAHRTDAQIERIRKLGGMQGLILMQSEKEKLLPTRPSVPLNCGRSSNAWVQQYLYAIQKYAGRGVGIASDTVGATMTAPRFGPDFCGREGGALVCSPGPCGWSYPFALFCSTLPDGCGPDYDTPNPPSYMSQSVVAQKTFDFNTDGLAHIGLLPDLVRDLQAMGLSSGDLMPLFSGAEQYVCMWENVTNGFTGGDDDPNVPGGEGDGYAGLCDNCPTVYNPDQKDSDHDGLGDACHFELKIQVVGPGRVISANLGGINCGSDCSETYRLNTDVVLQAITGANSVFTGWSGDCSGTGFPSLTMNRPMTCTATFQGYPRLSVNVSGQGAIKDVSPTNAVGGVINCTGTVQGATTVLSGTCSAFVYPGTAVTLIAQAGTAWSFASWTPPYPTCGVDIYQTDPSCVISVSSDTTVSASLVFTDVSVTGLSISGSKRSYLAGETLSLSDTVTNTGTKDIGPGTSIDVGFYLSTDQEITTGDLVLQGGGRRFYGLNAGQSSSATTPATIPSNTTPGTYFVGSCVDPGNYITERFEGNNCLEAGTITVGSGTLLDLGVMAGVEEAWPELAYDPASQQYLAVWETWGSVTAEIRDWKGGLLVADFAVFRSGFDLFCGLQYFYKPSVTPVTYRDPATGIPTGGFLVAALRATSYRPSFFQPCRTDYDVVALTLSSGGSLVSSGTLNISGTGTASGRPDVAAAPVREDCCVLVVWQDVSGIRGQMVYTDANSARGGDISIAPAPARGYAGAPAAAYGDNGWLVAYEVAPASDPPYIGTRIVDLEGAVSEETPASAEPFIPSDPDVAFSANTAAYLVTYSDRCELSVSPFYCRNVVGHLFDVSGASASSDFVINSRPCGNFFCGSTGGASLAANSRGDDFAVVFDQNYEGTTGTGEIFGRRVDSRGRVDTRFSIFSDEPRDDRNPAVAFGPGGTFAVAWEHKEQSNPTYDVIAKVLGGFGPFTLNVVKLGDGTGTVSTPSGVINCGSDCSDTFGIGSTVRLEALNDFGSLFTGWGGDCVGSQISLFVTMDRDKTCTATFVRTIFDLTVSLAGDGQGSVTSSPAGIDCGLDCYHPYYDGTSVTLTAAPANGSNFGGWSGDCAGAASPVMIVMSGNDKACTATFQMAKHTLTVSKTGGGAGTVSSAQGGISCGADCSEQYPEMSIVRLNAVPDASSYFAGWSGDADCADGVVEIAADAACTAAFELLPDLTVLGISTNPQSPQTGADAQVTVTVKNQGPGPAGPFWVDFYKDRASAPTQRSNDLFCQLPALAAGATSTCTGSVVFDTAGQASTWAAVDIPGEAAETNESNNVLGPQAVSVSLAPPPPPPPPPPDVVLAPPTQCPPSGLVIDARPDDNGDSTPDNTSTSIGRVDPFVSVSAGATVTIDVLACVPRDNELFALDYALDFDGTALSVTSQTHTDPAVNLIVSGSGSAGFDMSESTPDCEANPGDGSCSAAATHSISVFDYAGFEAGPASGVAGRYTISVSASASGCFEIELSHVAVLNSRGEVVPTNAGRAVIGIGVTNPRYCAQDDDGDGASNALELFLGTDSLRACAASAGANNEPGMDAWMFDFNDDQRAGLPDVLAFIPVFGSQAPGPPYVPRFDYNADGRINLNDVLLFIPVINASCAP